MNCPINGIWMFVIQPQVFHTLLFKKNDFMIDLAWWSMSTARVLISKTLFSWLKMSV